MTRLAMPSRLGAALWVVAALLLLASPVDAQHGADASPAGPGREPVDRTRLDVARLPPEAATIRRELYDEGLFLEAQLGAATFVGDARSVSHAGPRLAIALGYELTHWFALLFAIDASMHQTRNRPPPAHTSYELVAGMLGARFSVPIDHRFALWAQGLAGVTWSSGDVLRALDFRDAFKPGLAYGGELGFDWHMRARHHSLGLLGGARLLPTLARDDFTLSTYGAAYLRYVF
jgi:hypothetical protein